MDNQINVSFADLEKLMFTSVLETFQRAMAEILSLLDDYLMAQRDKNRYEHKESKARTCITMVGTITIKRRYYWDRDEHKWVFLLDEFLGFDSGAVSDSLKELVVFWATKGPSYRDVRDRLEDLFGSQVLSHETIRQLLIKSSGALQASVKPEVPKKKVSILFIEADGFWTGVQKRGPMKGKKRETKLVVVHEGWEKRQKNDYRLKNPMYITSDALKEGEELWDRVYLKIWEKYEDIKTIQVVINGDFASWIQSGVKCFKNAIYQYDRFHLKRDIRRLLPQTEEITRQALVCVDNNNPEGLLKALDHGFALSKDEDILEFKRRLQSQEESVVDYRKRLYLKGCEVPDTWRGMGAAESNVDRFKLRTSKRGRSWSKNGLAAILNMLSLLYEGELKDALAGIDSSLFIKPHTEEIVEMSANQIAKTVGVGVLNVRKGGFPSTGKGAAEGYSKLFRQMIREQPI